MRPVGYALADDTAAHLYRCQELCGFDTHSSRSARRTRLASPPFSFIAASFSSARQQFSRGHAGGAMSAIRFPGTARFARIVTVAGVLAVLVGVALAAGSPAQPARAIGAAPASRFISVASLSRPARSFPGAAVADVASAGNPFRGVLTYLRSRAGIAQVAVFDKVTGKMYVLSDGPDAQYTASIVKADILAMWLRRYQRKPGTIPSSIPYSIRYLMTSMITMSDNVAATSLFYFGGGCAALTRFNTLIPTRDTAVGCQTPTYYGWGNTTTTAADQVAIVRMIAYPGHVLSSSARGYALQLMESVIPAQRWGVTCGPWGTACDPPGYAHPVPGVTVALKNGWKYLPTCIAQVDACPWQVNSIGSVQGKGRNYVLAVLTTDDPPGKGTYGLDYGITTIQGVSQRVWASLAPRSAP